VLVLLAVAIIVVPLVELYVIVQVGQAIGVLETIALMLVVSFVGAWLAKHEGTWVWVRIREQVAAGRVPSNELIDGALILAGGLLLLTPGFVSDVVGLVVLFPPTRLVVRRLVKRRFTFVTLRPPGGRRGDGYGPDDVIDV
jgi:UPF0716 protein FxsA